MHVKEVAEASGLQSIDVFYSLAPDRSLREFTTGDLFDSTHAQMFRERMLDHALSQPELETFRNLTYLPSRGKVSLPEIKKADQVTTGGLK